MAWADGIVLASMYTRKIAVPKGLTNRPAVLLNAVPAKSPPVPSVVPDEVEAGRTVARVLLDAGHRAAIGLVGAAPPNRVPKDSLAAVQRLQGITEALHEAGAEIAAAVPCPDWQREIGYDATKRLRKTKPSALSCFNDRLALGAYQALASD
jgi:LacI family transcriptional regulator